MSSELWIKIRLLDLRSPKRKLLGKKSWWWRWRNNIDVIEKEYRQFWYLIAANPGKVIVPWSRPLDDFWHEHILDTQKYAADCEKIFGRFLHHNPHLSLTTLNHAEAYCDTERLYREAFHKKAREPGFLSANPGCTGAMPVVFCSTKDSTPVYRRPRYRGPPDQYDNVPCGGGCGSHHGNADGGDAGAGCGSGCGGGGGGGD